MPVVFPPSLQDPHVSDMVSNPCNLCVSIPDLGFPETSHHVVACSDSSTTSCDVVSGSLCSDPVYYKEFVSKTASSDNGKETQAEFVQVSSKGMSIKVYKDCISVVCDCYHELGNSKTQLKPCRFATMIFKDRVPTDDDLTVFDIVCHGVDIVAGDVPEYECANYASILKPENKCKMDVIIEKEILSGALSVVHEKPRCVHAIGAVCKPDGGVRPITDCSRPPGLCVNDNVGDLPISFKYKSVDNVVSLLSGDEFMGIVDLKSAYRSVSINSAHAKFQGLSWCINGKQTYLVDNRLCFGSKSGPYYFNILSEFVYRLVSERYGMLLVNYLDDFIHVSKSINDCLDDQRNLIYFLRYLGFQISWAKVSPPSKCPTYLGIIIDSALMELRHPGGKLEKMSKLVTEFLGKKKATKKELEKLTGLLAHCATVIRGGRTFCRSLYNLENMASNSLSKSVWIHDAAKDDLNWWAHCACIFNGKSVIGKPRLDVKPTSDASGRGFGAVFQQDWFCGTWDDTFKFESECNHSVPAPNIPESDRNINVYELYPVLVSVQRWGHIMSGHCIVAVTDNQQVFYMIRTGRSKNPTCMRWLKQIFWCCVEFDIDLLSEYIPTDKNVIADTLSRLDYPGVRTKIVSLLGNVELCCKDLLIKFCRPDVEITPEERTETPIRRPRSLDYPVS